MTSEPVVLTPDATVAEALARIREPAAAAGGRRAGLRRPGADGHPDRPLPGRGALPAAAARAAGGACSAASSTSGIDPLAPATPLAEITQRMATYNLVAIAVVDEPDRLVGAVTVDDVLDHLLPRDWRDRDHASRRPAHG